MNTDQDAYFVGQEAQVAFGVLNDLGAPVCDATITGTVTAPNGTVTEVTAEDSEEIAAVQNTGACTTFDSTNVTPDYLWNFTFDQVGEYAFSFTAQTVDGTRTLNQSVEAIAAAPENASEEELAAWQVALPFLIKRSAATRLYPVGAAPMTVEIHFFEDFSGEIHEIVPANFEISDLSDGAELIDSEDGSSKQIVLNGDFEAGEMLTLSYSYDAPDESPQMYTVGPMQFFRAADLAADGEVLPYYIEPRVWQIANDNPVTSDDTDLLLWLRADAQAYTDNTFTTLATNGVTVGGWKDQTVEENHATQTSATAEPTWRAGTANEAINYHPVLDFDGVDNTITTSGFQPTTGAGKFNVYVVSSPTSATVAGSDMIFNWGTETTAGFETGLFWDSTGVLKVDTASVNISTTKANSTEPSLIRFDYNGTTQTVYADGVSVLSDAETYAIATADLFIGSDSPVANYLDGNIAEILVYADQTAITQTANDRALVESYLNMKYGIPFPQTNGTSGTDYLASTSLVVFDASESVDIGVDDSGNIDTSAANEDDYVYDIAMIGRDNANLLENTKSTSSALDGGLLVEMTDSDELDDREYLFWGNNNAGWTLTTDDLPASGLPSLTTHRVDREWRVQKNSIVSSTLTPNPIMGTFDITVYLDQMNLTPASGSNFRLVTEVDNTFATVSTQVVYPTSGEPTFDAVANTLTFTDVTLTDNMYFTLAVPRKAPGGIATISSANALVGWWKADTDTSSTVDGTGLTSWEDQSGFGNDATGVSGPTYQSDSANLFNFSPVIDFDNSADYFAVDGLNNDISTATPLVVYGVFDNDEATDTGTGIVNIFFAVNRSSTGNLNTYFIAPNISGTTISGTDTGLTAQNIGGATTNGKHMLGAYLVGDIAASADDNRVYFDGTKTAFTSQTTNTLAQTTPLDGTDRYSIGQEWDASASDFFDGRMAEVIVFKQNLTDTNRKKVESYLALKYGITISQTTPTDYFASSCTDATCSTGIEMWNKDAALASTYDEDIAGIGRDDVSELSQLSSKGINTDAIVTMTAASLDNIEFLTWGNDGETAVWIDAGDSSVDDAPTGYQVLNRTWAVQENSTDTGAIVIQVDTNDAQLDMPVITGSDGKLYFIREVSANNNMSDETPVQMYDDGTNGDSVASDGIYTISSINFATLEEFTFVQKAPVTPGAVTDAMGFWYKADSSVYSDTACTTAQTTNAGLVSCWQDLSGNNFNVNIVTSDPAYTTADINFFPAVTFDSTDGLSNTNSSIANSSIMNNVGTVNNTMTMMGVFNGATDAPAFSHGAPSVDVETVTLEPFINVWENADRTKTTTVGTTTYAIDGFVFNDSDAGGNPSAVASYRFFQNGGANGTTDIPNFVDAATYEISLGTGNALNTFLNGDIAEMIGFKTALSSVDLQKVESYLAMKYGQTLSQNHDSATNEEDICTTPTTQYGSCTVASTLDEGDYVLSDGTTIVWDSTTQTSFHSDVFGVVRDDSQGLGVVVSQSQNSDGIVKLTAESEGSTTTNTANSFVDIADKEALFIGNDGEDTDSIGTWVDSGSADFDDAPTGYQVQNRTWKVQETGEVGTATLTVNIEDTDFNVQDLNGTTLFFIRDVDGDGTMNDETPVAMTDAGSNIWTLSSLDLEDGEEFTFAQTLEAYPGGVYNTINGWWKADAGTSTTTEGATVTSWADQSGNSYDGTGSGNLAYRSTTALINYHPAIDFDGTSDFFSLASGAVPLGDTNYTMRAVVDSDSATTQYSILKGGASAEGTRDTLSFGLTSAGKVGDRWGTTAAVTGATTISTSQPFLAGNLYNSGASPELFAYLDGDLDATATGLSARATTSTANNYIGANLTGATNEFNGRISELVVYNTNITPLELLKVDSYLAIKYGITLTNDSDGATTAEDICTTTAQTYGGCAVSTGFQEGDYVLSDGTTVVWDSTAQSVYHADIFGLARDDGSDLDAVQASGVNTDAIITIQAEGEGTNTAPTYVDMADKEALLIGNDGPSTNIDNIFVDSGASNLNDAPTGYQVLDRVWSAVETGDIGTISFSINIDDADFDLPEIFGSDGNLYFIRDVDDDGTMNDETPVVMTNAGSGIWTLAGIDLDANDSGVERFTFAQLRAPAPGGVFTELKGWYKGDGTLFTANTCTGAVSDGSAVECWTDNSGEGNDFTSSNAANYRAATATEALNFYPTVDFNGSNDFLTNTSLQNEFTGSDPITMYSVFESAAADSDTIFSISDANSFSVSSGENKLTQSINATTQFLTVDGNTDSSNAETTSGINMYGAYIVGDTANDNRVSWNGEITAFSANATSPLAWDSANDNFYLGQECDDDNVTFCLTTSDFFDGPISEVILFKQDLSDSDRVKVESYLALKYGITITTGASSGDYTDSDGTVIWDGNTGGADVTYHNAVVGIGRDDAAGLEHIESTNESQQFFVFADSEGTDNGNATFVDIADKEFLLSGRDSAVMTAWGTLGTGGTPTGYQRVERTRKVREQGEVGTVTIAQDFVSAVNVTSAEGYPYILIDADIDGDFTDAVLNTDLFRLYDDGTNGDVTANDDIWSRSGLDLENNQLFTYAQTQPPTPGAVTDSMGFWFRADTGTFTTDTTNGECTVPSSATATIGCWEDQSGNDSDLKTETGTPTYTPGLINNFPAVAMDGTNDLIESSSTIANSTFITSPGTAAGTTTVLGVFTSSAASQIAWAHDTSSTAGRSVVSSDEAAFNGNGAAFTIDASTTPAVLGMVLDDASGTAVTNYRNGATNGTLNSPATMTPVAANLLMSLGARADASNDLLGNVAEFFAFTTALDSTELQKVNSYLSFKYGITLSQTVAMDYLASDGTTQMWDKDATGASTFNDDIFGIGRDDDSDLGVVKSTSVELDSVVTIEAETEGTNLAPVYADIADLEFLTIGNNGSSSLLWTDSGLVDFENAPTGYQVLKRTWQAQETVGEVGTIELTVNTNDSDYDLPNITGTDGNLYFIRDASGDGDMGNETPVQMYDDGTNGDDTASDGLYTIATLDLEAGEEFTFAQQSPVTPGNVTDTMGFWFKADTGTYTNSSCTTASTTTATIGCWIDSSVQGTNLNIATGTPTFTTSSVNGFPAVLFDGTNDLVETTGTVSNSTFMANTGAATATTTVLGVYTASATGQIGWAHATVAGDTERTFEASNSSLTNNISVAKTTLVSTTPVISGFVFNDAAVISFTNYLNAKTNGSLNTPTFPNTTSYNMSLGAYADATSDLNGKIAEFFAFQTELDATELQKVNSYLAMKYRITLTNDNDNDATTEEDLVGSIDEGDYLLSDGTTTVWDSTTNTGFHNDVFGVVRDDTQNLDVVVSTSIETDSILTVTAVGEGTNLVPTYTDIAEDEALFIGNDNASTTDFLDSGTSDFSDAPTGYQVQARTWKVQKTGDVGSVTLEFNIDDTDFNINEITGTDGNLYFVRDVDGDGTFNDETPVVMTNAGGGLYTITISDLVTAEEFTIAQLIPQVPGGVSDQLNFWVRAKDIVDQDTDITNWPDASGYARDITANNASPAFVLATDTTAINYNPSVDFVSGDNFITIPFDLDPDVTDPKDIYIVYRSDATGANGTNQLLGNDDGTFDTFIGTSSIGGTGAYVTSHSTLANVTTKPVLINTYLDDPTASASNTYVDGIATGVFTYDNAEGGLTTFQIGAIGDSSGDFDGRISEVLIYEDTPTQIERQQISSYLGMKYGIALTDDNDNDASVNEVLTGTNPSSVTEGDLVLSDGTTIVWDDSAYTAFSDVFGIVRDEGSDLDQVKSKSGTASAIITVEAESEGSNGSPTYVDMADKEALFIARDTATATTFGDDDGAGFGDAPNGYRIQDRTWISYETGDVGTLEISVDTADTDFNIDPITGADGKLYLVIDTDGDSTFNDETPVLMSDDGTTLGDDTASDNIWTTSAVNLDSNERFTFAEQTPITPGGVQDDLGYWFEASRSVYIDSTCTVLATTTINLVNSTNCVKELSGNASSGSGVSGDPQFNPATSALAINYYPALHFDGDDYTVNGGSNNNLYMNGVGGSAGTMSLFSVFNSTAGSGAAWTDANTLMSSVSSAGNRSTTAVVGNVGVAKTIAVGSTPAVDGFIFDDAAGTSLTNYQNGAANGSSNTPTTPGFISSGYRLGNDGNQSVPLTGTVPEVVIFKTAIDSTEQDKVETYLAIKYGITLSQSPAQDYTATNGTTQPWDKDTTDGSTYDDDITIIGRDDATGLEQIKSQSVNTDGIVIIEAEGEGSNGNGTFVDLADFEFLAIGNEGETAIWTDEGGNTVDDAPSNYQVLNRTWQVQEAGDSGTIELSVNVNDSDLNVPNITGSDGLLYFVRDITVPASNDMSDETPVRMYDDGTNGDDTASDNIWTLSGINLAAAEEFTFAQKAPVAPGAVSSGMEVWFKANANVFSDLGITPITNGGSVHQWNDLSGNDTNATQTGASTLKPTYASSSLNFFPALTFDGGDHMLHADTNLPAAATARTFYSVSAKDNTNTGVTAIYTWGNGSAGATIDVESVGTNGVNPAISDASTMQLTATSTWLGSGSTTALSANGTIPDLIRFRMGGATADDNQLFHNGISVATDVSSTHSTTLSGTADIGATITETNLYDGAIAEIVIYSQDLVNTDAQKVDSYLALKYGMTLSADTDGDASFGEAVGGNTEGDFVLSNGTTVVWDYSTNTAFHSDIFGIVRDDDSGLGVVQSTSMNGDSVMTLLADSEGTNAVNSFVDIADYEALTVGNDNESAYWTDSAGADFDDAPSGYQVLSRTWKVQETGEIGTAQLSVDIDDNSSSQAALDLDLPEILGADGLLYFVRDADGDGTLNDETPTVMTNAGSGVWTLSSLDLEDGEEFTIAQQTPGYPGGVYDNIFSWYRADEGVFDDTAFVTPAVDGTDVSGWKDRSGNERNTSAANGTNDYKSGTNASAINFNPVVDFDGTDDFLTIGTTHLNGNVPLGDDPYLFRAVFMTDSVSALRKVFSGGTNSTDDKFELGVTAAAKFIDSWGSNDSTGVTSLTTTKPYLAGARYEASAGTDRYVQLDGKVDFSEAEAGTRTTADTATPFI